MSIPQKENPAFAGLLMVGETGLEPARVAPLDPKSSADKRLTPGSPAAARLGSAAADAAQLLLRIILWSGAITLNHGTNSYL